MSHFGSKICLHFPPFAKTLCEEEFKSEGLIDLAKEISSQSKNQAVV